jgi:addiction module HigA family antidote
MIEYQIKRPLQAAPAHPGELMREIIEEHVRIPVAKAAREMGITRAALYTVLNGKGRVTSDMALLFGKLTGAVPDLFLHMQDGYDLWHSRQKLRGRLGKIRGVQADNATSVVGYPITRKPEGQRLKRRGVAARHGVASRTAVG